jgi:putative addiction module component (TIGR02574 family)
MRATVEGLTKEAIDLPEDQRLTLAYRILSTLEPPISAEIEEAWEREISGRITKFREGKSKSIPADEVFAELDDALKK